MNVKHVKTEKESKNQLLNLMNKFLLILLNGAKSLHLLEH